MNISENVKRVIDSVSEAAIRSGRMPSDISIVAATKMNGPEKIQEAISSGIKIAGENRVQEMLEKQSAGAYNGADLHFIGHLQKNKVKNVVPLCSLIQSADSKELLDTISACAVKLDIIQDVLIEVNIGRESAKSGIFPEQLDELVQYADSIPGIRVLGLMTVPPICESKTVLRNYFDSMYKLFIDISSKKYDNVIMKIMSMGMSGDFIDAIESGANMVRVGTAIFGSRDYSK